MGEYFPIMFLNKFRNGYFGDYIQINGSEVL